MQETAAGTAEENERTALKVYVKKTIGKGSFGRVKYCVATVNDESVGFAVKIINKHSTVYRYNSTAIEREISILRRVRHTNLIRFIKIVNYRHHVYMYMEYCRNGDLGRLIRKNGPFVESDARELFTQIVAAIEYLHGMDVAHRDLKPENVLLNHLNRVKVADFGLANFCRDTVNNNRMLLYTRCGTRVYMPPEVLNTEDGYNPMFFDVWSMGGVLHYMLTGQVPFDGGHMRRIVTQQVSGDIVLLRSTFRHTVSAAAARLVQHMLEPDVLRRARIAVIKQSKWMVDAATDTMTNCTERQQRRQQRRRQRRHVDERQPPVQQRHTVV